MGVKSLVKQVLTEKENKRYRRQLADRKMTYDVWLAEQEKLWADGETAIGEERKGGDSRAEGAVTESDLRETDFVLVCAGGGRPAPYARQSIQRFLAENPEVQVVYGDEDVLTEDGEHKVPWFKPDWSPDLLDSCLYFGSLTAVRRQRWQELRKSYERIYPGRWRQLFGEENEEESYRVADLDAYEKWLHDCVSGGYEKGSGAVGHIPQILFHTSAEEEQARFLEESSYLQMCRKELLTGFFERLSDSESACKTMVSVVIPSKDQPDILRQCVESVKLSGADIPFEIIVVDNGSEPENKAKIEKMLWEEADNGVNGTKISIRYLYNPMEFNFSLMCNMGAGEAKGKLLLFLNDDVVLQEGCIQELAARAVRAYTGAVGIKLLYPDTGHIQHAGITNLPMGPVHKLQSMRDDRDYYGKTNHSCRNFLAVTAACLMVEREKFTEAGGFAPELRVAFNDVDFCFRLYELGYYNVCLNDIYAYHYESLSRGDDESMEKLKRLLGERKKLYERHPGLEGCDPFYSDFLNRDGLDVRIAPAYQTAGNRQQSVSALRTITDISAYREDRCLRVSVEDIRSKRIVGWSVVLGDNNACYKKTLLLRSTEQERPAAVYGVVLEGQYRPDLEENMPDQANVALGGFMVEISEGALPEGRYRVGICACNRVTGLRLVNWSNRTLEV